jgi:cobalt-zinc-cadmium efflux system outer membrane protein
MLNINKIENNLGVSPFQKNGVGLYIHTPAGLSHRQVSIPIPNATATWAKTSQKLVLIWLLILIGNLNLKAQETLTLDTIFNRIAKSNPALKVYDQKAKSEDAQTEGAKAWKAPMFGVGTFMMPYNNFAQAANMRDGSFMLTAEQAIPNKSNLNANQDYLAAQSAITLFAKAENLNQLKAFARMYFYEALVEQKKLNYIQKNIDVLSNLKKLAEIRYTYNKAGLSQIYSLEAKIANLKNTQSSATANIKINKIRLNVLMNRPANTDFILNTPLTYDDNLVEDVDQKIAERSNIKQYDAMLKSNVLVNKIIATETKPEFNVAFNHMIAYNNVMPNQFSLMVGVGIPLVPWAAKGYKSKLKANQLESLAIQQEKADLINNLTGEILAQQQRLNNLKLELENFEQKIIPALQKSYEVMLLSYQENKEEINNVLDSWIEINNSELEYLDLLNTYYQTYAEYEKNLER